MKGFIISSTAWLGAPHGESILQVRDAGFGGVEILCKPEYFEPDNQAHVAEVVSALKDWPDADVTFHAPFWTADLASSDPGVWDESMRETMQGLDFAALIGARVMTVHVRKIEHMGEWDAGNLAAFHRSLDRLANEAQERQMTIAVENLPPPYFTSDANDLISLIEGYPDHVGFCIDTGHGHLGGRLVKIAWALASRTFISHLHDNSAHGKDEHKIPGQGTVQWAEFVGALQAGGFRGRPVIEVVVRQPLGDTLDMLKEAIVQTGLSGLVEKG